MKTMKLLIFSVAIFNVLHIVKNATYSESLCTTQIANTPYDCNKHSAGDNYCCLLEGKGGNSKRMCYSMTSYNYVGQQNMDYGGVIYNLKCGVAPDGPTLPNCGWGNETTANNCWKYNSASSSCCYYGTFFSTDYANPNIPNGCYYLGSNFKGNVTWQSMDLMCDAKFISLSAFLLLLALLFI